LPGKGDGSKASTMASGKASAIGQIWSEGGGGALFAPSKKKNPLLRRWYSRWERKEDISQTRRNQ